MQKKVDFGNCCGKKWRRLVIGWEKMSTLSRIFFGRKEYRIDPKGRIPLSAEYYDNLDLKECGSVVIAPSLSETDRYLEIFSMKEWNGKMEIIDLMPDDDEKEWIINNYVSAAISVDLDNQNRIRIPKSLLDYAGIEKDVVFVGAIKTLRLWSKSKLGETEKSNNISINSVRDKINQARKLHDERGDK